MRSVPSSRACFHWRPSSTPNLPEAEVARRLERPASELAERIHALGASAVIVTGGHGDEAVDHLFDGREHIEIPVDRHDVRRPTAPAARTRLSSRCAWPAATTLEEAAIFAAAATSQRSSTVSTSIGAGEGPVDVFNLAAAR